MQTDLIRLTFVRPLRGNAQQGYIPSDQLWGALYASDALLQEVPLLVEQPFRVSSAFPFAGQQWLLPKPRVAAQTDGSSSDSRAKKEVKRLRFVGLSDFLTLAAGKRLSPEALAQAAAQQRRALLPVPAQQSGLPLPDVRTLERLFRSLFRQKQDTPTPDEYARKEFGVPLADLTPFERLQLAWHAQGRPLGGQVERQRNTQDRVTQATDTFMSAEMAPPNLGFLLTTTSSEQRARVLSALRLLADDGLGGQRSHGSGQFEFEVLPVPENIQSRLCVGDRTAAVGKSPQVLLSLTHPTSEEAKELDSSDLPSYGLTRREGYLSGSAWLRRDVWMLTEGSWLPHAVNGSMQDVRPPNFPHPVYRSGLALSLSVASREVAQ